MVNIDSTEQFWLAWFVKFVIVFTVFFIIFGLYDSLFITMGLYQSCLDSLTIFYIDERTKYKVSERLHI